MLCTVMWDVYQDGERNELWRAIGSIIPRGSPDWSRKGIYAYWDPDSHELLYVGLATDLMTRFAQHNRLVRHAGGNKAEKIDEWFGNHRRLGFTLLVQAAAVEVLDHARSIDPLMGVESSQIARIAEGQLLELHRRVHGRWPVWNGVGGSVKGAEWARESDRSVIRLLSAQDESLFVARRTIQELASDEMSLRAEALVHGARMRALLDLHNPDVLNPFTSGVSGGPQVSGEPLVEQIMRFLMLAEGKLIDDLSPADEAIRAWVVRFSDAAAMNAVRDQYLAGVRDLRRQAKDPRDREMATFNEFLLSADVDIEVARDAAEVLAAGYLDLPAPFQG